MASLNAAKDIRGNVEGGAAEVKAVLDKYDACNATNAWDLDSRLDLAMAALRLPPPDADVTTLSGGERRRVALCRLCSARIIRAPRYGFRTRSHPRTLRHPGPPRRRGDGRGLCR